nr:hypothetical protein CFP56_51158 [Quercus suber]
MKTTSAAKPMHSFVLRSVKNPVTVTDERTQAPGFLADERTQAPGFLTDEPADSDRRTHTKPRRTWTPTSLTRSDRISGGEEHARRRLGSSAPAFVGAWVRCCWVFAGFAGVPVGFLALWVPGVPWAVGSVGNVGGQVKTKMKRIQTPKPTSETGPQEKIPPGWRLSFAT